MLRFTPRGLAGVALLQDGLSVSECDLMHMTGKVQRVINASQASIKALSHHYLWGEIDSGVDPLYSKTLLQIKKDQKSPFCPRDA